jgi:mannose-6-phosphate isomerase-like protein (cupin superfamily)
MSKSKKKARRKERKELRHGLTHNMSTVNEKEKIKRVLMAQ